MIKQNLKTCETLLNDPERLKAVEESGLMDSPPDEALERLNLLAAKILKAPISIFTIMNNDRQYYKSTFGLPPEVGSGTSFPMEATICQYALQEDHLAIEDTKNHPAFADNGPIQQFQIGGYLGVPVTTKAGHVFGTVCVFDVVPKQWSADELESLKIIANSFVTEVELKIALRKAEKNVKNREDFLSIASHEMKTPLTSLRLQTDLAESKYSRGVLSADHMQSIFKQFKHQFSRLNLIVDDLFDISRISSGKLSLKIEKTSLDILIEDTLKGFAFQLEAADCHLESEIESEYKINCDAHRIEQVITNILNNALKYAPKSPVAITMTEDNGFLKLSISDQGPGITQECIDKIFDPFQRFNGDKGVSGLGLGLYISKQIMVQHGGDLLVESNSGKGSTFTLVFPLFETETGK